jgi:hypothetical protein
LWPTRMFEECDESPPDFLGFIVSDKRDWYLKLWSLLSDRRITLSRRVWK